MTSNDAPVIQVEVTLKNGVWVHETEWAAIQRILEVIATTRTVNLPSDLYGAFWVWKNVQMDVQDAERAIKSLTKIAEELSSTNTSDKVDDVH